MDGWRDHIDDYNQGKFPIAIAIAQHEKVATAYGNAMLNLAMEVTDRINAGEFRLFAKSLCVNRPSQKSRPGCGVQGLVSAWQWQPLRLSGMGTG